MTEYNPLRVLEACGTSVWSDYIRRSFVENGDLQRLVGMDGISGVTSNPTIFEKAISGSSDYDGDLEELAARNLDAQSTFHHLAARDIQMAADVLRPVYDATNRHDGYVSIEVTPQAAHDTQRTMDDAHNLWKLVARPNIMIKVPATPEGIPAIEELIAEGINVNVTLIFAVAVYERVMDAYLKGLERRAAEGKDLTHIASVASFFVSRVDSLVDKLLEEKKKEGRDVSSLEGHAAIANAKIAYERFEAVFGSERFTRLQSKGAQIQRPLWASTSTKNPTYPDTMYVDGLVGRETVNTMPPQTINAVRDHGQIRCGTVQEELQDEHLFMQRLAEVGIDMDAVTDQLTVEGVKLFADSQEQLFKVIEEKTAQMRAGAASRQRAALDGQQGAVDTTLNEMSGNRFVARIWEKDPSLWKPDPSQQSEITDRLGWLHVSDCMLENRDRFTRIASWVKEQRFTHAVVLGMGGSSLAPYVFAQCFGRQDGYPQLHILDSTDPDELLHVQRAVDPPSALYIVSSKSGTTIETLSHFRTFWKQAQESVGESAGEHFVAVTDPDTPLEKLAEENGFHECFLNPSDIGGRYSALSYFGLVPAAVMGVDVPRLLDKALDMEHACAASVAPDHNPGAWLGAIMGDLAKAGCDKITFFLSPGIESLGLWLEQLLAESTGKEGKGLIPVPDDPPGTPADYGDDRLFVQIRLESAENGDVDSRVDALEKAGHPVVRLTIQDLYELGSEFFRWEFATAVAGAIIGINAFNQPNVQESKDNTKRLLQQYEKSGRLQEPEVAAEVDGIRLSLNEPARQLVGNAGSGFEDVVQAFLRQVHPPEYVALMAYIASDPTHDSVLQPMRVALRDGLRVAATLGYGPRFLHSTGQLHKGGTPEGVFIQITADAGEDVPVPGEKYSYQTLIRAQALGDFQSLQQHGRPALRIHLPNEQESTLRRLLQIVEGALRRQPSRVGTGP